MLLTGQCNTNSNILYYLVHQHGVIAILHTSSTKICLSTSFSKPVRRSSLKKRVPPPHPTGGGGGDFNYGCAAPAGKAVELPRVLGEVE